jgi:putative heme iron utilization protein
MADRPLTHQVPPTGNDQYVPSTAPELPPSPEPSHAERARTIVAGANRGTLCTVAADPPGYPFGSVATYALDDHGAPLFFVSLMAEHTQNARRDRRASLLVAEPVPEGADPLAGGRVTLLGDLTEVPEGAARAAVRDRYLAANPTSAYYIDFGDFAFYRLGLRAVRYVGGYGRMSWVPAPAFADAAPDPLAPVAAGIVGHMNRDHADALVLLCHHLAGRSDTTEATMSAVDRYGFEVVAVTPDGRTTIRLGFPKLVASPEEVRAALVAMVREARTVAQPPS